MLSRPMVQLSEVLAARQPEVMQYWLDDVRGTLHPETMPRVEPSAGRPLVC